MRNGMTWKVEFLVDRPDLELFKLCQLVLYGPGDRIDIIGYRSGSISYDPDFWWKHRHHTEVAMRQNFCYAKMYKSRYTP